MKKIAVIVSLMLTVVSLCTPATSFAQKAQNAPASTSAEQNQDKREDRKSTQPPKESQSPPEKKVAAATTTTTSPSRKKERESNGGIFKPSEEISEDFAVSFPVDI